MSRDRIHISPQALFRYQWVAEIETRVLAGEPLAQAIDAVRSHPRSDSQGRWRRPSKRSLYRWYATYQKQGLSGLEPKKRPRVEGSRVLTPKFLELLRSYKTTDPELSVPDLILTARTLGVLGSEEKISRTSVWRACRRMGLATRRLHRIETADTRRFAYPHRMMMVLSDGKHFRAGAQRLKRVALTFIDDATRYGLGVLVGTAESTALFLEGVYQVILYFGLMNALYLDHGPGFISDDTHAVIARLKRRFIHGRVRYPEGHGKIERFHRTMKHKVLRSFDGHPEIDPECGALTLRLNHWLKEHYNHTPHESLGGMTPHERWQQDERNLVLPKDRAWLDAQFFSTLERTVSKDHVVSISGTLYEVPQPCRGRIQISHHLLRDRFTVRLEDRDVEIHPLDLVKNALDKRARKPRPKKTAKKPITPANEAYKKDFGPLVDSEGNYNPDKEEES